MIPVRNEKLCILPLLLLGLATGCGNGESSSKTAMTPASTSPAVNPAGNSQSAVTTVTGPTPLHKAAMAGKVAQADQLIADGADLYAKDDQGLLPGEHCPARTSRGVLLMYGVFHEVYDRGNTAMAITDLKNGAEPSATPGLLAESIEYANAANAEQKAWERLAYFLASQQIGVNTPDRKGVLPLDAAVQLDPKAKTDDVEFRSVIVRSLLTNGVPVDKKALKLNQKRVKARIKRKEIQSEKDDPLAFILIANLNISKK